MIETRKLKKIFCTEEMETTALNGVSIHIDKGEFVSVMGPSGCGKTTLINILGLLDTPTDGNYFFLDQDVSHYSEKQRACLRKENIGFIFQSFNLIDELTIYDNVELPLLYRDVAQDVRRERVRRILERFDLVMRSKHYPPQLSGGEQQRAAVARAVVGNPVLVLADEPTGNLDSVHGEEVMQSLKELNESGTTIVMVTHSPTYAEYGKHIIELFDGSVINGDPAAKFHL